MLRIVIVLRVVVVVVVRPIGQIGGTRTNELLDDLQFVRNVLRHGRCGHRVLHGAIKVEIVAGLDGVDVVVLVVVVVVIVVNVSVLVVVIDRLNVYDRLRCEDEASLVEQIGGCYHADRITLINSLFH